MIKYAFSLFLVLITLTVMGQKKSVVNLIQSKSSQGIKINGKDVIKVYQGVFKQDYSVMRSDSAYFYIQDNAFDAFGHVNITQGDTLNIFSDKLNYNGNTKLALLTDNVKMVDKDATLTTNFLTYNTATRIGTYTGGGKLINRENTLTSKNGYYFAFSREAYFRYNVVLITPEALIKTDTLRYSTASRIAYFLGPTNIYDVKDKKDTLYTENGTYNTITEQAFFGKKNLYKSGTKSLKGDSLFYDKLKGFGRAIKHVVFHDREQNVTLKGDLANYYKAEERTVVTKDPFVIIVTEEKDTTKTDTVPVTALAVKGKAAKTVKADTKKPPVAAVPAGTMPIRSMPGLPISAPAIDSLKAKAEKALAASPVKTVSGVPVNRSTVDTLLKKAGNLKMPSTLPIKGLPALPVKTAAKIDTITKTGKPDKIKRDSIYISADTLETQILTYKNYKLMLQMRSARVRDTTSKAKTGTPIDKKSAAAAKKDPKLLVWQHPGNVKDTLALHRDVFVKLGAEFKKADSARALLYKNAKLPVNKNRPADTTAPGKTAVAKPGAAKRPVVDEVENDPVFKTTKVTLSDTARIRIIRAYHHAKLFKSDLQAKADSMFYANSDSTLRLYVQPIIWTQGSQLSADTIHLQMKDKKLDNMYMFPSSFIVNIEKDDSTFFNQISGKRMKGFFKKDKLDRMFITGNAESIYFTRDSGKVSGMQRSLSSRMRILFKNNNASNIFFLTKPEHRYGPLKKFQDDERILKGFIWRPKERPISKESILPSYGRKNNPVPATGAATNKKPGVVNPNMPKSKMAGDSLLKKLPVKLPVLTGKDSAAIKAPAVINNRDSLMKKMTLPFPAAKPKPDPSAVKKP